MPDQIVIQAHETGEPRRAAGWQSAPLTWVAFLLVAAFAPLSHAQTNTAKAAPAAQRWLLIVETSRSMQRRSEAVLQTVQDLLNSGMGGQLRPGDTLGVWTFNAEAYTGKFPLQRWATDAQQDIASRTIEFLKGQKYEKPASFDKLLPIMQGVVRDSQLLTVVLVTSGDEPMLGTPFDAQINEFYQKWRDEQQKAQAPFVTVLRGNAGQLADYTLNTPPFAVQLPRPAKPPQIAQPTHEKLLEAVRQSPPPTLAPLIFSGKNPQPITPSSTTPEPAAVKIAPPAPTPAAPETSPALLPKPPAPALPPVEVAKVEPAPVKPAQPPVEIVPKPMPPPPPAAEPKPEAAKPPEPKPVEPPPIKPEPVPALPPPAPTPPPVAPKPALAPAPVVTPPAAREPVVVAAPPAAAPTVPIQTATAVPVEASSRYKIIWIAGMVFAGLAAAFAIVLLRRSCTVPRASLITQSIDRKHKL